MLMLIALSFILILEWNMTRTCYRWVCEIHPFTLQYIIISDLHLKEPHIKPHFCKATSWSHISCCGLPCFTTVFCYCSQLTCIVQCRDSKFFRPRPLILLRFKVGQFRNFPTNWYIIKLHTAFAVKGKLYHDIYLKIPSRCAIKIQLGFLVLRFLMLTNKTSYILEQRELKI